MESQDYILSNGQWNPGGCCISSVQSLSCVGLFVTPWTAARQASLSITNSSSLLKLMSIELVMPSSHLILCPPLLFPPSIFPSIRVFPNGSVLRIRWRKYWSFSFSFRVWYMLVPNLVHHFLPSPLILSSDWMSITKGTLQAPAEDGDFSLGTWITQRSIHSRTPCHQLNSKCTTNKPSLVLSHWDFRIYLL